MQRSLKEDSDQISNMTRLIYSNAHQLALQVEKGENNISHLIDRVSHDVVNRAHGLSESIESLLSRTREVQTWTTETYQLVCSIRNYTYVPIALIIFWIFSRSQPIGVKFQLIICLVTSILISVFANFDTRVLRYIQSCVFAVSAYSWLRSWVYNTSDLQKVLIELRKVEKELNLTKRLTADDDKMTTTREISRHQLYYNVPRCQLTPGRTSRGIYNEALRKGV